jgi:hypothetical protein
MTYLEIEKFYYPQGTTAGDDAPFRLKVKGLNPGGIQYAVQSWAPIVAPADSAIGTITINIVPSSTNSTKTIELGTHEVGKSKTLDIVVMEGTEEKENKQKNYDTADPEN